MHDSSVPHTQAGSKHHGRPRFNIENISNLADDEIIQLIIEPYCQSEELPVLAARLIEHFGCLCGILKATAAELVQVEGIGIMMALHITLFIPIISEFRRRTALAGSRELLTPEATMEYAKTLPAEKQRECIWIIVLDAMFRIIRHMLVCEGGPANVHFDIQYIVRLAIQHNGENIIIVHNHTAGEVRPSPEDILATNHAQNALDAVGIHLADHIIVADELAFSFAENGMLVKTADPQPLPAMPIVAMPKK